MIHCQFVLIHSFQFNGKRQSGVWWNGRWRTAGTVRHLCWNDQLSFTADSHSFQAMIPTLDHVAFSESKLKSWSTQTFIKHLFVISLSHIEHVHFVAVGDLFAVSNLHVSVLDATFHVLHLFALLSFLRLLLLARFLRFMVFLFAHILWRFLWFLLRRFAFLLLRLSSVFGRLCAFVGFLFFGGWLHCFLLFLFFLFLFNHCWSFLLFVFFIILFIQHSA
mmetsp:Transcript_60969/g.96919  ORF Transcript_60969/g.96919 Transcript_60969/m.96919 type:complete len:220 (+) Transcript_60969:172-831(+)